jgi:hypothetical protein
MIIQMKKEKLKKQKLRDIKGINKRWVCRKKKSILQDSKCVY